MQVSWCTLSINYDRSKRRLNRVKEAMGGWAISRSTLIYNVEAFGLPPALKKTVCMSGGRVGYVYSRDFFSCSCTEVQRKISVRPIRPTIHDGILEHNVFAVRADNSWKKKHVSVKVNSSSLILIAMPTSRSQSWLASRKECFSACRNAWSWSVSCDYFNTRFQNDAFSNLTVYAQDRRSMQRYAAQERDVYMQSVSTSHVLKYGSA
jgi:hypothetical protein